MLGRPHQMSLGNTPWSEGVAASKQGGLESVPGGAAAAEEAGFGSLPWCDANPPVIHMECELTPSFLQVNPGCCAPPCPTLVDLWHFSGTPLPTVWHICGTNLRVQIRLLSRTAGRENRL